MFVGNTVFFWGGRLTRRNCCVTCSCVECHYVHLYHQAIILGMSHHQRFAPYTTQKLTWGKKTQEQGVFHHIQAQKNKSKPLKKLSMCA